jgi:hypothetical protein
VFVVTHNVREAPASVTGSSSDEPAGAAVAEIRRRHPRRGDRIARVAAPARITDRLREEVRPCDAA